MQNWKVFGHYQQKKILDKQLEFGLFAHAYLFLGPEGVGKKFLALELAKKILSTDRLDNHPDFQILDADGEIVMEQTLDFIGKLAYKPFLAPKKIAIINNAQNLNLQSSNALLKTLEEPSESTIIILISSQRLLPTIISRCQVLNFNLFGNSDLQSFAAMQNKIVNPEILNLSFGQISRMIRLQSDMEFLDNEKANVQEFNKINLQSLGERLSQIAGLAESEVSEIYGKILTWLFWQASLIKESPESFFKVQALQDALLALKKNRNKKLVLQGLFLKI